MSQLFSRIFLQILDSSIAEDFTVRHVFEDFLKICDYKTGIVDMTRHALSRRFNLPIEILNDCISKLESPDPNSRDQDNEGRRLQKLDDHRDWGWRILNWDKYDAIRTKADAHLRVVRHRNKDQEGDPINPLPESIRTEAVITKWDLWMGFRRGLRKPSSWSSLFNEQSAWLGEFSEAKALEILSQSIRNGWTGLFEPKSGAQGQVSPSVAMVNNKAAIDRVESRIKSLRGQSPFSDGDKRIDELSKLRLERERLKKLLGFKA